jgi:uncharacterized protein
MEMLHRDLHDVLEKYIKRREIIVIRGPRQAGKTTLMKGIEKEIGKNTHFVNFENAVMRKEFEESPLEFVRRFAGDGEFTLFLDEVQKLNGGGEKLKLVFDEMKGLKIFASGSSSLEMKANVLHELAGRALIFELLTLGFGEFLQSRDMGLYKIFNERNKALRSFITDGSALSKPALTSELLLYWKEYVIFGGYPEVVKSKNKEEKIKLLSDLFSLYVDKDVVSFFRIEEANKFMDFSKAASFNAGNILVISAIANDLHITPFKTEKFLSALTNTYIVDLVYPFYKNLLTELKKSPKPYFMDLGLRNSVIGNFTEFDNREDRGILAENFVFRELITMGFKTKYWRTSGGAEMDFIIETSEGIVPIEVKLGGSRALGKGFYSFIETYKPRRALVITLDEFSELKIGNTVIFNIPIFYI